MTGLDCNVLVQLALADHPANAATVAAAQAETQREGRLVFPPVVVTEFLHVVTDARRFAPPLTVPEALDWIEDFLANPTVGLWSQARRVCARCCAGCGSSTSAANASSTPIWPPSCTLPESDGC